MASGRVFQIRSQIVAQSAMVMSAANGHMTSSLIELFLLEGKYGAVEQPRPPALNRLTEKIITDIHANKGKLIVDEEKFKRMAIEP